MANIIDRLMDELESTLDKAGFPQTTYLGRFILNTCSYGIWFYFIIMVIFFAVTIFETKDMEQLMPHKWDGKSAFQLFLLCLGSGASISFVVSFDK
ncbi:hypothetical protein [Endozoicomonas sp. 4G]|uniref:hypothetical protein n=1 Tax=Endozoicomonas sp. 4G TaxID=2872754 RepID=UPI00207913C5|nr:hypothetical protein [Endozoicomonas sp. 4G]